MCHGSDWTLSQKLKFANKLAGTKVLQEGFLGLGRIMQDEL
jgi:ketohexokinase